MVDTSDSDDPVSDRVGHPGGSETGSFGSWSTMVIRVMVDDGPPAPDCAQCASNLAHLLHIYCTLSILLILYRYSAHCTLLMIYQSIVLIMWRCFVLFIIVMLVRYRRRRAQPRRRARRCAMFGRSRRRLLTRSSHGWKSFRPEQVHTPFSKSKRDLRIPISRGKSGCVLVLLAGVSLLHYSRLHFEGKFRESEGSMERSSSLDSAQPPTRRSSSEHSR